MGVIAVRNESVRLSLDDQFTTGMARAAAATALLSKELHNLDGSNASLGDGLKDAAKETEGLGKSTEGLGKSSESASSSITRLANTLNKQTGATTLSTRAMVAKTLADRGALEAAEKLGVSVRDVTDAALGNHDALTRMNASLSSTRTHLQGIGASTDKFDTDAQKLVGSVSRMSTEMSAAETRVRLLASAFGTLDPKTESGGKSIDKFSGRLGLLADAAIVLGPALLPLGASTIPLLTGAIAGLGAAAGGIGTAVLAFHGLGAAMKALDAYNLDPTIENLKKLQAEEKKIGPAGSQFVQFIDDLEPKLKALQTTARQRMFPGLEDGITSLLTRLPEVRAVIAHLADGLGQLAREAGASLSGPAWTPFFEYLRTTAEPTLLEFGHATGEVALGLSRLLVAFAPLSGGFTSGIERAAKAFADWSAHLDTNQSFQRFLAYVQESGPKVLDLLGSLAGTFAAIAQAAAPVGQDVLPVLTDVVRLLGVVAASPFGSAFVTGLVALRAYVRVAQLAVLTTKALGDAAGAAGVNLDTMGGKARFAVTALIGLEVAGQVMDGIATAAAGAAPNVEKLAAALISADQAQVNSSLGVNLKDTLASLDPSGVDGLATSFENLGAKGGAAGKALALGLGGFVGLQSKMTQSAIATKKATDTFQSLDAALTEIATTGGPEKAQAAFKALADAQGLSAAQQKEVMSHLPQFSAALLRSANTAKLTAASLHQVSAAAAAAKADVLQLNDALSALSGWFDKRAAMRAYKASLDDLVKSLKNGFQPKDVEKIDAVGQSMLQVANSIKDPALRRDFLASARASLEKIASDAGPKGKAAIDKVIGAMDRLGATAPKVKIDADDRRAKNAITGVTQDLKTYASITATSTLNADGTPAKRTISGVDGLMASLAHKNVSPHISVDPGNSFSILGSIKAEIASIRDKTVTIRTVHAGGMGPVGGQAAGGPAGRGRPVNRSFPGNARRFASGGKAGLHDPLFTSEGPRFYRAAYKHNSPFAVPNPFDKSWPYQTPLTRAQEAGFEQWVNNWNIPFQLSSHLTDYDMRGFWKKKHPKSWTQGQHFPDTFKTPYDTTFSHESKYATADNPFYWHGDKLIDVRTGQVVFAPAPGGEQRAANKAEGGSVFGPGGPRDDLIPAWLSNREFVQPVAAVDYYGVDFMEAVRTLRFADGGSPSGSANSKPRRAPGKDIPLSTAELVFFNANILDAAHGLKGLKAEISAFSKALDSAKNAASKARDALSALKDQQASAAAAAASPFQHDLFGNGLAGLDAQAQADTNDAAAMLAVLKDLVKKGLSPQSALFQMLASSGDLTTAQQLDALDSAGIAAQAALVANRGTQTGQLGSFVGNQEFTQSIKAQNKVVGQLENTVHELAKQNRELAQALKAFESKAHQAVHDGAKSGSEAGAAAGTKRGMDGQAHRARALERTGA